ncbi:cell differentiation family, Rcd1 [Trichuris suis]|nr:cell differentiation family, Rcd1 [Trichuris suis]
MNLALKLLCQRQGPEVGVLLWSSPVAIPVLLRELQCAHVESGLLRMNSSQSRKVSRIISLLQCICCNQDLTTQFLEQNIPSHVFPFITTNGHNVYLENSCKACLIFFISLLRRRPQEVVRFLLRTVFLYLCAHVLYIGGLRLKERVVIILLFFLADERGYELICRNTSLLILIIKGLNSAIALLHNGHSPNFLCNIILCYTRLAQNERARAFLRHQLPDTIKHTDLRCHLTREENLLTSMELLVTQVYCEPIYVQVYGDHSDDVTQSENRN